MNKTAFILLLGFPGFWHKIWQAERDTFLYWCVTYVLFSTTEKRYVMNQWIILGFVPATVYGATSASPPINDFVSFHPFLKEDYQ